MSKPRNRANVRTYIIKFKDGSNIRIDGLDISVPAAGKIHSPSTQEAMDKGV